MKRKSRYKFRPYSPERHRHDWRDRVLVVVGRLIPIAVLVIVIVKACHG